jgi:ammonium transporter, Amt family
MNSLRKLKTWLAAIGLTAASTSAWAQEGVPSASLAINTGDTAWMLMSTGLVLLMTIPGLALFYGGLVRRKNVLSVLMQCFMLTSLISVQWMLWGYTLAFGPDMKGMIGGLGWFGLRGVGQTPNADYAATVPHQAFMIFQAMFAIITPALIIGAFAERMRFLPFCVFSLLWSTLVYDPVCHWVWGVGGFIRRMGALDFAGGTVVHINAGVAALAAALVLRRRLGYPHQLPPPHSLPFAVVGASLLWVGWFGFNAGSALSANGLAVSALVVTHMATAAASLTWAIMDLVVNKRPTVLGIISGGVAGLVAITPASGYVTVAGAMGIGIGAGILCYLAVMFVKARLGYDDALDAFGVHGVGGLWGALATGLWATRSVNPAGADGLFHGNPRQLWVQALAATITLAYSFVVTWGLLKAVDALMGLRVSEEEERIGLDLTQHREAGYTMLE